MRPFIVFCNVFDKFNNTGARMLDSVLSYDIQIILKSHYWCENVRILPYMCDVVKSVIS